MADNRPQQQQQQQKGPPPKQVGTPVRPEQQVIPVDPPDPPPERAEMTPTERMVADAGFEPLHRNAHHEMVWQDPHGEGSKRVEKNGVTLRLPQQTSDTGEKERTIHQSLAPAASWKLTTSQALRVIKQRKAEGGDPETPILRLEALGKRYDALCDLYERLAQELDPLLRRPVPEKRENLAREVGDLKTAVAAALHHARQRWETAQPRTITKDLTEVRKGEPAA